MWRKIILVFFLALAAPLGAAGALAQGLMISEPMVHGNLSVYPIHGAGAGTSAPLTLDAALAGGQARIHEVFGGRHTIDNLSDRHLFLQAGDLVKGGSQDQVIASSVLVPPGVRGFAITMFCVERNCSAPFSGQGTDTFSAAGLMPWQSAKLDLFAGQHASPTTELLRRIGVWLSVDLLTGALGNSIGAPVRSAISPSSLPLALEDPRVLEAYAPYINELQRLADSSPTLIGVVIAINGKVHGAEVYASNELFRAVWPKLLRAFAIQAIALRGSEVAALPTIGDVTALLLEAEAGNRARALYSVLRHSGGDWVHKSYVARSDGAATGLEAAVLKAIETGWSTPLPTADLSLTNLFRYREAVLIQALAELVLDRSAAMEHAKRAGLPTDPQQILQNGRLSRLPAASPEPGTHWSFLLLVLALFAASALLRLRFERRAQPVAARPLATAACRPQIAHRPSPPQPFWARLAAIPSTSVPVVPRAKVRPEEDFQRRYGFAPEEGGDASKAGEERARIAALTGD